MLQYIVELDGTALLFIQEYVRMEWLNPIVLFFTSLGNAGAVWIVLAAALLIQKNRACHGNLFAVGVLGDEPAVKELGMPPKALYCHTAACPIGDGRGLVFPFWAFHQFHGRSVGNVLPYAPEDRYAPIGFGSHHLPVQALCGGPLSHGRAVRYANRGAGCSVFPEDNKRQKWK